MTKRVNNINDLNKNGINALHAAVIACNTVIVHFLIHSDQLPGFSTDPVHKININYKSRVHDRTALHFAAGSNRDSGGPIDEKEADDRALIIQMLIKANADVNAADKQGMTALHYAVKNRLAKAIPKLTNAGAMLKDGKTLEELTKCYGYKIVPKPSPEKANPSQVKEVISDKTEQLTEQKELEDKDETGQSAMDHVPIVENSEADVNALSTENLKSLDSAITLKPLSLLQDPAPKPLEKKPSASTSIIDATDTEQKKTKKKQDKEPKTAAVNDSSAPSKDNKKTKTETETDEKTTPTAEQIKLEAIKKQALAVFNKKLAEERDSELKKCQQFAKELTDQEYAAATAEFKTLIEFSKAKKHPIYIAADNHSRLPILLKQIDAGMPYHEIISLDDTYGVMWPLLLRLYYREKDKDKDKGQVFISIDQLHSMMKICYWRSVAIEKVESLPFFSSKEQKEIHPLLKHLLSDKYNLVFPNKNSKDKFINNMLASTIPEGERSAQLILLGEKYARIFIQEVEMRIRNGSDNLKEYYRNLLENYNELYVKTGKGQKYNFETAYREMIEEGAAPLVSGALATGTRHCRMLINPKRGLVLVRPSVTVLRVHRETVNSRPFKFVRRLEIFGPNIIELHADRNERVGNLLAPGTEIADKLHGDNTSPLGVIAHDDDYHSYVEGLNSPVVIANITPAKSCLRQIWPKGFVTEIFRLADRDATIKGVFDDGKRLLALLKMGFAVDVNNPEGGKFLSRVSVLIDMIIFPDKYSLYPQMKKQLIDLLLPVKPGIAIPDEKDVEQLVKTYWIFSNKDIKLCAILVLTRYYLNDENKALCEALLNMIKQNKGAPVFGWEKHGHGFLYPFLLIRKKVFLIELLADTSAEEIARGINAAALLCARNISVQAAQSLVTFNGIGLQKPKVNKTSSNSSKSRPNSTTSVSSSSSQSMPGSTASISSSRSETTSSQSSTDMDTSSSVGSQRLEFK